MKAWQIWPGLFVCAIAALLMAPAGAGARAGYIAFAGEHTAEMSLQGSDGYTVQVLERNRHSLQIYASQGPRAVTYTIRHTGMRSDGIDARLPGVGRVSVQFHPTGRAHRESAFFHSCKGGETIERPGYFQGTIRLRGERGYTSVRRTKARGQTVTRAPEICKRSIFGDESDTEVAVTQLLAYGKSEGRTIAFSASTPYIGPNAPTFFFAYSAEQHLGMAISRLAFAEGTEADFAAGGPGNFPLSATVTPPDPFVGSAVFQRVASGDNTWTGSLSVSLPGMDRVALTGPSFSTQLCRDAGCRHSAARLTASRRRLAGPPRWLPGADRRRRARVSQALGSVTASRADRSPAPAR